MNKEKAARVIMSILIPLLLLLLSYKITLAFFPLTPAQEETLAFLADRELSISYTALERSHLEDVREVMNGVDIFLAVLLIAILGAVYYLKESPTTVQKSLRHGGIATIGILLVVLLFSFLDFTALFTWFHQLFFPQGNWSFPAESLLIQTFPAEFFVKVSRTIFLLALVLGIGALLGSRIRSKRT